MLAFTLLLLAVDPELDALLDRLEAHETKLAAIYENGAFTVTSVIQNLDRSGKATSTTDVETRVTHEKGDRTEQIIRKIENGKDVTPKAPTKVDKEHRKKEAFVLPFAKSERAKYRFTRKGPDVIAFEPAGKRSTSVWKGEATVDPVQGHVLEIRAKPSKNPFFVDKVSMVLELGLDTKIGPTPSKLSVDGEGGMLFYRKRIRIRTEFSDYVLPE
jgi:hypothetical protein